MRINAVFSKKVSTAQYENETFTVTVEAESEFNNIARISGALGQKAADRIMRRHRHAPRAARFRPLVPHRGAGGRGHRGRAILPQSGLPLPVLRLHRGMRRVVRQQNQTGRAQHWPGLCVISIIGHNTACLTLFP